MDSLQMDSLQMALDSNFVQGSTTLRSDSTKSKFLEEKVVYISKDSMHYDIKKRTIYLFGEAEITYGSIHLKADYIEFDMQNSEVFSSGLPDSTGKIRGTPEFTDKGKLYESEEMRYNFKSKRGLIKNALTEESDGFVQGTRIKREPNDIIYVQDGRFCPCDDPIAGTYIKAKKIKIIPEDKIVTGPANLYIEDIPTPLILPFGIFPNQDGQANGILFPEYGYSPGLGFFLRNGGYYIGISDYMDLQATGDIYTNGSWGSALKSSYVRKYKYTGNASLSYSRFLNSERDLPDFSINSNFFIRWNHTQDRKANPARNFSASVNAGSSNNFRTNFNSQDQDFLNNSFNSNIAYNFNFPNKPFNLTLNASHAQNNVDSSVSITLPQATFNVQRIQPFKRTVQVGKKRFYEDIGINYSAAVTNRIRAKESELFDEQALRLMQNGLQQNISTSLNLKVLKHFTLTPQADWREVWYTQSISKDFDIENNSTLIDTISGFRRFSEQSASLSMTTTLYGMYNFKRTRVKAIRHKMTPTIGWAFQPGYASKDYGYYETIRGPNARSQTYSVFEGGVYGQPRLTQAGNVTFRLINNVEMKVLSKTDSVDVEKKVKLIENFNVSTNYNMLTDSLNLTPINLDAFTTLFKNVSLRGRAILNPYQINDAGNIIDNYVFSADNLNIGRLTAANLSLNFTLKSKKPAQSRGAAAENAKSDRNQLSEFEAIYADIPWSVNFSYAIDYTKPAFEERLTQTLMFDGRMQITQNWDVTFRSGLDLELMQLTYTSIDIYRMLGCWEMRFGVIPFGSRKSYTFSINVRPQMLKDLKYDRRREWFDFQ